MHHARLCLGFTFVPMQAACGVLDRSQEFSGTVARGDRAR
jgi:hypothetical protein